MPLVKVKQKYQVTIPSSIRESVPLDVGDILEATVSKDGILLKPQTVVDRKKVVGELRKVFSEIDKKSPYAGMKDDEIMKEAVRIVKEVRQARRVKKSKQPKRKS